MYTAFAATVFLSARQEEVFGQKFCLERRPYEPWGRQLARKSPVQPPLHSLPASALLLMRAVASPQAGVVVRDRAEVRCWYPNHKNSHPWEPFFRPRGHPRSYCRATERDRSFPESNGLPRDVQVLRSHATEAPAALSACQDKPASSGRHQPSACGDGNAYGHGGSIKGSAAVQPLDLPPQSIPKHIAVRPEQRLLSALSHTVV